MTALEAASLVTDLLALHDFLKSFTNPDTHNTDYFTFEAQYDCILDQIESALQQQGTWND